MITKECKNEIVNEFGSSKNDTGSSTVQIALFTTRIKNLTEHLKLHKHDQHTRRGLLCLVGQRRRLLSYLKTKDVKEYRSLIQKLNIRK